MTRALLFLALTACGRIGFDAEPDGAGGDDAEEVPAIVDGSRLKAAYWEMDGARLFAGWTDTLLQVDCGFVEVGDGLRCLPYYGDGARPLSQQYSTYSDAACSVPSFGGFQPVEANACAPMPPMIMHGNRAYTVGAQIVTAPYLMSGATCTPFGALHQWALSNPLDETAFVHATKETVTVGELVVGVVLAEDGARAPAYGFETAAGQQCFVQQRPDGTARCVLTAKDRPATRNLLLNGVPVKIFGDAACTIPAAIAGTTDSPAFVHEVTSVPCGEPILDDYDIGAEVSAGWVDDEGTCAPLTGYRFYLVGAKRPPAPTLLGTWQRTSGGARLHSTQVTLGGARFPFQVWDDTTDAPCDLQQDRVGTIRCLSGLTPATATQLPVHRSSDCTDATQIAYPMCGAPPITGGGVIVMPQPQCQAFGRTALTTAATSGLYRGSPGRCEAIAAPLFLPDDGERPPTDFVAPVYRRGGT